MNDYNIRKALQTDYAPSRNAPAFGNLVMLIDQSGNVVHIWVWDVVFTKRGTNQLQPWVIMRILEGLAIYPSDADWSIVKFHHKNTRARALRSCHDRPAM